MLSRDETIRIEALNKAISLGNTTPAGIIIRAKEFEGYIKGTSNESLPRIGYHIFGESHAILIREAMKFLKTNGYIVYEKVED